MKTLDFGSFFLLPDLINCCVFGRNLAQRWLNKPKTEVKHLVKIGLTSDFKSRAASKSEIPYFFCPALSRSKPCGRVTENQCNGLGSGPSPVVTATFQANITRHSSAEGSHEQWTMYQTTKRCLHLHLALLVEKITVCTKKYCSQ